MPFTKIESGKNKGKYRSPSGRIFTKKQVALYHAHNQSFPRGGNARKKKPKRKR